MAPTKWEARVDYDISCDEMRMHVTGRRFDGSRLVMFNAPINIYSPNRPFIGPEDNYKAAFVGNNEDLNAILQSFMDLAWERGLRPTGRDLSLSEIQALKSHLNDMRAIVAHTTKAKLA